MTFKITFICAVAFLVQSISANCIGNGASLANNGYNLASNGLLNSNLGYNGQPSTSGGNFVVTSSSPIAPTGISVVAENLLIEGPLEVVGRLPLLGTVALEGAIPTGGQAGTSYGCGNGNVGITSEIGAASNANGFSVAGIGSAGIPLGANLGAAGLGLNGGLGCNRLR